MAWHFFPKTVEHGEIFFARRLLQQAAKDLLFETGKRSIFPAAAAQRRQQLFQAAPVAGLAVNQRLQIQRLAWPALVAR